jgi:hypothetical protein
MSFTIAYFIIYFDIQNKVFISRSFFYFQKLQLDFATFLQNCGFTSVYLCGDNGQKWEFGVLNPGDLHRMKLGYGWDEFCVSQNFKAGDLLEFKFEKNEKSVSKRVHVFKVAY